MKCVIVEDDAMAAFVLRQYIEQVPYLEFVEHYESPVRALVGLQHDVDLVFLDIEMPEMTGLEFLKTAKRLPQVIICSSKPGYAISSYEYEVTDYLLKPIEFPRFIKAIERARAKQQSTFELSSTEPESSIFVKSDGTLQKLNLNEIQFVESLGDYIVFRMNEGRKVTVHNTLKYIEEKLPVSKFMKVHRSYIVNLEKVSSVEEGSILIEKSRIPLSGSFKEQFYKRINLI